MPTVSEEKPAPVVDYVLGLDLGKVADYSALVLLERRREAGAETRFAARHIQRWPRGTDYPSVVSDVAGMLKRDPLPRSRSSLVVDATGVGNAVVDMFRKADLGPRHCEPGAARNAGGTMIVPVVITGGFRAASDRGTWHVPKRTLIGACQVALQNGTLRIAARLAEAGALVRELKDFRVTITEEANDVYGGRAGTHDDLVLALALGLWWGEIWQGPEMPPQSRGAREFANDYGTSRR